MSEQGSTPAEPGRAVAHPSGAGRYGNGTGPGNYPRRDPVAEALGKRLGILPSSAHQVLVGPLRFKVAEVIASFDDVNEFERRERWLLPIRAMLDKLGFEPYSKDLLRRAQVADSNEEIAQTDFQTDPCPLNRNRYIEALIEQYTTSLALAMALIDVKRQEAA